MSYPPAFGQNCSLVKDVYPGPDNSVVSGNRSLTNVNGTVYFAAKDGIHGQELWKSDGTATGTVLVKDINPGASNSNPDYLTNVNGTLYFSAVVSSNGVVGYELWKSDGTAAGTVLVKDIAPGVGSSLPADLINVSGTLYFTAEDGTTGRELWKSDGTTAGTVMVRDISPNGSSNPTYLFNLNGTLYFVADNGTTGKELWKSDGTTAGTVLVKDINPGTGASIASGQVSLANVNGTVYFQANDGMHGRELWKSDGTAAGTELVRDINPGASDGTVYELVNVNGTLYFTANDGTTARELWKSDGTAAGTVLVKDINPGASSSSAGAYLTNVNGILYLLANDGLYGQELWKSDGTDMGTVIVKDINPGPGGSSPFDLTSINGALYFRANDGTHGIEVWKVVRDQAITFGPLTDQTSGQPPFALSATASSGLPVSFTVVSGPATISGNTLTLSGGAGTVIVRASQPGDLAYNAAQDVERSFTVSANSTSFIWNGTGNWTTTSYWSSHTLPGPTSHATIASGTTTLTATASVQNLTLQAGTSIVLAPSTTLLIYGDLTNNGGTLSGPGTLRFAGAGSQRLTGALRLSGVVEVATGATLVTNDALTLEDGAILLHGTGTPNGGGSLSGQVSSRRQGKTGWAYNGWSSSVAGADLSLLGATRYGYDESRPMPNYARWIPRSGTMNAGVGYFGLGSGTITFTGSPNEGTIRVPLTYSTDNPVAERGFNLVGNPYPGPLDYPAFIAGNPNISGTIYFWDDPQNGTTNQADYCVKTAVGSVAGPHSGTLADDQISSHQGFFVRTDAPGQVVFTNAMRTGVNNGKFFRIGTGDWKRLKLSLSQAPHYQEILLAFGAEASPGVDRLYDGMKIRSPGGFSFYSQLEGQAYAIQALPEHDQVVALGVEVAQAGVYRLQVPMLENFSGDGLWLEDKHTGQNYPLAKDSSIPLTLEAGANQDRFALRLGLREASPGPELSLFGVGQRIQVRFSHRQVGEVEATLFNLLGQVVESFGPQRVADNGVSFTSQAWAGQIYLVKLRTDQGIFVRKLYLAPQ